MLESMRNQAQSWIAKFILGGIALSFALWGIGDYFMGGRIEPVAEVDGSPIGQGEFAQVYERQLNSYRSLLGKSYSKAMVDALGLKEETIQTLINRRLMLDEAKKLGLTAPEQVVVASVRSNPAFTSAGSFDPQRYRILTRNMGFASPQDYESDLRLNLMVDALQAAIIGSARVGEQEIRDRFNREYEQRVLAAIIVDPEHLAESIKVGDEEAKAWYEANKSQYQSPLRVKLAMIDIDPTKVAKDITVAESEIQAAYEARKQEFVLPEERKARHILIKVAASASDEEKAKARAQAEKALARIKGGEDFAKVAKAMSGDTTADKGGELGWFRQGTLVPAFDAAVFGMQKGDLSSVIETRYGFHVIQLEDIRPAAQQSLAEVHDRLLQELRMKQAADEAYKLSQDLDDALGMEGSLVKAAEAVNLPVKEIGPISKNEAVAEPLLADPKLRNKAFASLPGQPVDIVETGSGHFIAFEVVQRVEPEVMPYAQVTGKVMADAKRSEANDQAKKLAENIRSAAAAGQSIDALVQKFGQPKFISKPVRLNGAGDSAGWLTTEILNDAFVAAKGQWLAKTETVPEGLAIVQVQEIVAPNEADYAAVHDALAQEVEKSKGAVRFARWMANVRDHHEIAVHPEALARF